MSEPMPPLMPLPGGDLRSALIATCREMNNTGINQGTSGNASVRCGADRLLITPSGLDYQAMTPDDIVELDTTGRVLGGIRRPSSEWHFHAAILKTRPEISAVVHTHSPHATALSCLRRGIPAFHYMVAVGGGHDIRCADYATFGTEALAQNAVCALDGRHACLLANHGLIALGSSLDQALARAVEVEALARQYLLASQAGTPVILDADEMDRVIEKFKGYGPGGAGEDTAKD